MQGVDVSNSGDARACNPGEAALTTPGTEVSPAMGIALLFVALEWIVTPLLWLFGAALALIVRLDWYRPKSSSQVRFCHDCGWSEPVE
ncbi:MAG: hypothetical protein ACM31D_01990 [Bacteroidota bacterium]